MKKFILTISIAIVSTQLFAQVPTNGLVGYYPFEGNANDAGTNGYHGTASNISFTGGVLGQAAYGNGTNGIINFSTKIFPQSGDVTISFWRYTNSAPGFYWNLITENNYGWWGKGIMCGVNSIYYASPTGQFYNFALNSNAPVPTVKWEHVVYTWKSGSYMKSYINGIFTNSVTSTITNTGGRANTTMFYSTDNNNDTDYIEAYLDEVRIYNRELNEAEILSLTQQNKCLENLKISVTNGGISINSNTISGAFLRWYNDNNSVGGVNTTLLGLPLADGNYYAKYDGCTSTSNTISAQNFTSTTITSAPVTVTSTITGNCPPPTTITSVVTVTTTVLGTLNSNQSQRVENYYIETYPNPSTGEFKILKEAGLQLDKIELINNDGKLEESLIFKEGLIINPKGKGLYLVKIYGKSGQLLKVEKIVIQ